MKNSLKHFFCSIFVVSLFFFSCTSDVMPVVTPTPKIIGAETAISWAEMTNFVAKKTTSNTPTYASRALGYIGLTMYETVVHGSLTQKSLSGQLSEMPFLTVPDRGATYNWVIAMNAGQAAIIKKFYPHASEAVTGMITLQASEILAAASKEEKPDVVTRSVKFGETIANEIFEWAKTDGGDGSYARNFPTDYVMPTSPGSWTVPVRGQTSSKLPLHPYWGKNRNLVRADAFLFTPPMIPHSDDPQSQCYAQFLEVYSKNKILTDEEKEIAVWWSDDPAETIAPPGHSYNLATITLKKAQPDLFKAAETYARVGLSVADAFINCWRCKYTYFSQRPAAYIARHIDASYIMFWPEPPFPAFISGHATQAAAAATVLTDLYGNNFSFTDNTHEGRPNNALRGTAYRSRSFNSFWEAAEESAYSRFLGGIHARQDNEVGLAEGRKIGRNVNALTWKK
ncbi:MAG: vanadium-dependent haloperoxidase [Saprospiraceae bacterium]|nr:vanadium-dependent haloperoxidase [Saprospiraceae bacterium]